VEPMSTAPRDRDIDVNVGGQWFRVFFLDCAWLREGPNADLECTDCWRLCDEDEPSDVGIDFELSEPIGWREPQPLSD
jgi:hypothetical protein